MSSRRIFLLIVTGVVLLVAGATLWQFHFMILTNKAVYLRLQGHPEEAQRLLEYVVGQAPEDKRAQMTLAQVEQDLGNYAQAELLLVGLPVTAECALARAIGYYETDREDNAREWLKTAESLHKQIEDPQLANLIAGGRSLLEGRVPGTEFLRYSVEDYPRSYQRFFLSLQSRVATRRGEFEKALEFAERAIALGDRNRAARRLMVIASAAAQEFARARYYADIAGRSDFGWQKVLDVVGALETNLTTSTVAPSVTTLIEKRRIRLAGARAWVLTQLAQETSQTSIAEQAAALAMHVCTEMPYEVQYQLLASNAWEIAGKPELAYKHLLAWANEHNAYPVQLRLANLAGEQVSNVLERFARLPNVMAGLRANDFSTTGGQRKGDYLAFYVAGKCMTTFTVETEGEYYIVLTARGDRAFGLSPLVALRLDGEKTALAYIASEEWSVYSFPAHLTPGVHTLEVEYLNNSERLPSDEEDRNFYLHNVMITRAEVESGGNNTGSERSESQ